MAGTGAEVGGRTTLGQGDGEASCLADHTGTACCAEEEAGGL